MGRTWYSVAGTSGLWFLSTAVLAVDGAVHALVQELNAAYGADLVTQISTCLGAMFPFLSYPPLKEKQKNGVCNQLMPSMNFSGNSNIRIFLGTGCKARWNHSLQRIHWPSNLFIMMLIKKSIVVAFTMHWPKSHRIFIYWTSKEVHKPDSVTPILWKGIGKEFQSSAMCEVCGNRKCLVRVHSKQSSWFDQSKDSRTKY